MKTPELLRRLSLFLVVGLFVSSILTAFLLVEFLIGPVY